MERPKSTLAIGVGFFVLWTLGPDLRALPLARCASRSSSKEISC